MCDRKLLSLAIAAAECGLGQAALSTEIPAHIHAETISSDFQPQDA
jgi:hypothetical protein